MQENVSQIFQLHGMSLTDILTIFAIIIGPIFAVVITRYFDTERLKKEKQLFIFRSFMKTRKMPLHPEHVDALNLIEVEFHKKEKIISAYHKYIDYRHEALPSGSSDDQDRHSRRGNNYFLDLLYEISNELGYEFDKSDLERFSYTPIGWGQDDFRARKNASLITDLLEGRIALPVTPMQPRATNLFPPAPITDQDNNEQNAA